MGSLTLSGGVSATVGLIALAGAASIWFIGKGHWPRVAVLLVLTGAAGMVGTPLGTWLRHVFDWLNGLLDKVTTRWTGAAATGVIAAIALYALVIRLRNRQVDRWTFVAAGVVPVAVATIPGPVGAFAYSVVTGVAAVIGWAIGQAFGLG
jgi:hypothetical protein